MARVCELTGVKPFVGNKVSHSNRKTRTRWLPNLKKKKYFVPELSASMTLYLTTRAIRTIDKHGGLVNALMKGKDDLLSADLLGIKKTIQKMRRKATAPAAAK